MNYLISLAHSKRILFIISISCLIIIVWMNLTNRNKNADFGPYYVPGVVTNMCLPIVVTSAVTTDMPLITKLSSPGGVEACITNDYTQYTI